MVYGGNSMPDLVLHYYFADQVFSKLSEKVKKAITNRNLYTFASAGPDPFFFYKFLDGKENRRISSIGHFMHEHFIQEYFVELARKTKASKHKQILFSYLTGFLTHHALDSKVHPYVFYKTGHYVHQDESTHQYRGLHTRFEHALDVDIIEKVYKRKGHKFKIHKELLKLNALPIEMKEDIDAVYKNLYGLQDAFYIINGTIVDQKKFYQFIYDPCGLKNLAFKVLDSKKKETSYRFLSYFKRREKKLDVWNNQKQEWMNPADHTLKSKKSVWELLDVALEEALARIEQLYLILFEDFNRDLEDVLPSSSYATGLEKQEPMQYFDNIYK